LLAILCGLLLPTSGAVCIDGVSLNKANLALIRNRSVWCFKNPGRSLFMPTVLEDVAFGLQNRGYQPEQIEQKALQTLEHLNILHLAGARTLSALRRGKAESGHCDGALHGPAMLLFDEPTAFLDPRSKRNLIHLLRSMTAARLVATHDSDLVSRACKPRACVA
jgi:cobalt/nickel transport system ATP-binding protein